MLCWGLSSWQCQHVSSHVDRTYFSWWHPQYVLFVGSCRLHDPYVSHLPISHWWTTNEILLMYYVYSLTSSTLLWIRKLRGLRFLYMKLSCPLALALPKCFSSFQQKMTQRNGITTVKKSFTGFRLVVQGLSTSLCYISLFFRFWNWW